MYKTDSTGSLIVLEANQPPSIGTHPNLVEFEQRFRNVDEDKSINVKQKMRDYFRKKISKCSVKRSILGYFPIIDTLITYQVKEYLPNDMISGLTAGVMMIPQGMAFAALSTLPPIVGLYISFFASLSYFLLGTGRQLSWGCIAILSLMMAGILDKYDNKMAGGSSTLISCVNASMVQGMEDFLTSNSTTTTQSSVYFVDILSANITTTSTPVSDPESASSMDEITRRRMGVASGVSIIAGLILTFASRIGLSRITAVMSDSLITGYAVGISFHVATSQFKGLLGLSIPRFKGTGQLIRTWIALIENVPDTNVATLITSLIAMLIIYVVKRHINERFKSKMKIPIPIELFVVIAATIASRYAYLNQNYKVTIIKDVPIGVPAPKLPDLSIVTDYIGDALVIIIVAYAQSLAMAKTMALKHDYEVNVPQEMLACGLSSVVCGLFSGYITGASVSRSMVQDGAGGKTQVASLFAACLVLLVIMVLGPYFYFLPKCVLSAIIVVNLRSMFLRILEIPREWRKSRYDCSVWVFCCLATIVLNPDIGLLAGVVFSIFLVVLRSMMCPIEETGQIQTSTIAVHMRSISNYAAAERISCVKVIRLKSPLYFINSEIFLSKLLKEVKKNQRGKEKTATKVDCPETMEFNITGSANGEGCVRRVNNSQNHEPHADVNGIEKGESVSLFELKVLIIDMAEVSFIDIMGIKVLELLIQQSSNVGVAILFAGIPESIFGILQSTGFWKKHGERLFLNVEGALNHVAVSVINEKVDSMEVTRI